MPPRQLTSHEDWRRSFRRALLNGPPLSGKTTGLLTCPRPLHVIVAPGELGYSSIQPGPDVKIYVWEFDPVKPTTNWSTVLGEFDALMLQILTGKNGQVVTLSVDGLHRLYDVVMLAGGWTPDGDPKMFGAFHGQFLNRLSRLSESSVPYLICTAYDGTEPVEGVKGQTQIWPDFPGKMAKRVLGAFTAVFYTQRTPSGVAGKPDRFTWRLRPQGKVQGVGIHIPVALAVKFPEEIEVVYNHATGVAEGGWQTIETLLGKETG